jgi:hypothetical protein
MAELAGLAASVIGIGTFGASVTTRLRTFAFSYSRAEEQTSDLSNNLFALSGTMICIGEDMKEYRDSINPEVYSNLVVAKNNCETNFKRLERALKRAIGISGKSLTAWEKLKFACGGEGDWKEIASSINTSTSTMALVLWAFGESISEEQ